jgi:hypothetical protein
MRLTYVSWSLPLALVSTMAFGQQTTASPTQQSAANPSSAQNTHAKAGQTTPVHHRARSRRSKASSRRGGKRPAYRPEYTQNSVEVMNGASTQKVVFHKDEVASGSTKNKPAPLKVEVVNGTATDTQYFSGDSGRQGQDEKRPVVVAIQSSDTRVVGGNKHPVVTGIMAVGPGDAKSASGGGQKVTTGVAPKPKRSEYQPDAH